MQSFHHLPDPRDTGLQRSLAIARDFVGALHFGDGLAGGLGHLQHFNSGFEWIGNLNADVRGAARSPVRLRSLQSRRRWN